MIYYLDASALVKVYSHEDGTKAMVNLLKSNSSFYSSVVIYSEVLFALRRKLENGEITKEGFSKQIKFFESHFQALINRVQINENIFDLLRQRILSYSVKALDAIHLASALWLKENIDTDCKFICSDKELLRVSKQEGLPIINPVEMD